MGVHKYSRQFESYFSGQMTGADRILFEGRVESDPMLKAEFNKQNDVVEALKAHRSAELKTRLNNISVEPTLIGTLMQGSVLKSITYGITGLMVATGGYLFYNQDAAIEYHIQNLEAKTEHNTVSQLELGQFSNLDYRYEGNMQVLDYVEASPVLKKQSLRESHLAANNTQSISFEVPDVNPTHQSESLTGMGIDLKAIDKIEQVNGMSDVEKVNIQTINSRKYHFHYRLEDNRLFLYGKFNESPYEIIEISAQGTKTLFFYYQGDFYQLRKKASSITPLSKIENKALIVELDALKSKG